MVFHVFSLFFIPAVMIVYNCKENKKSGDWWCGHRAFSLQNLCWWAAWSLTPFNRAAILI